MKKLKGSLLAKTAAILLLTVTVLMLAFSVLGVLLLADLGAYPDDYKSGKETVMNRLCLNYVYPIAQYLYYEGDLEGLPEGLYEDSNFRFQLYDENGALLYDNLNGEDAVLAGEYWIGSWWDYSNVSITPVPETPEPTPTATPRVTGSGDKADTDPQEEPAEPVISTLKGYVLEEYFTQDDISFTLQVYDRAYEMRYGMIGIAVGSLIAAILLFVFLMSAAGHRDGSDTITPNVIDRIPFDLFTVVMAVAFGCILELSLEGVRLHSAVDLIAVFAACFGGYLVLLLFFMSLATRLKLRSVIKSCVVYRVIRWCWRLLKKIVRVLRDFVHALPLLGRSLFIIAAVLLVEFFYICATQYEVGMQLFGWFLERAALLVLAVYVLVCLKKLRTGASRMAQGDMNYTIDTKRMYGDLLDHANDLNNIQNGINKAVNERMKSEHFKTELITNVSHDIKTPLTSIVNYVDLLSKEEIENEKAQEYIEVLQRQSARLKKLTEDLVEASKASTGNLAVNLERCELGVLLDQTAGEYGEKLSENRLELILKKPEEPVTVMADGRHLWRILDNLMNNVCKYAQPGTRVYLNLEKRDGKAVLTFRNMSKYQLNISGDELMERFVRGDSSRNTEGSGLGLSIARSLAQLQGAKLDITVDGDLFKVTLAFDEAK